MIGISGKTFSPSHTQQYALSIRFTPDGFCFAILDEEGRLLHYTHDPQANVSLSSFELLQNSFRNVYLCCDSCDYTLLPKTIFQEQDIPHYWKINFGTNISSDDVYYNEVRLLDVVNLFGVDKELLAEVRRLFPSASLVHRQTMQIHRSVRKNKQEGGKQVFLYMNKGAVDVVLVEKGALLLANTFRYHSDDEFLYFVLNVFDQLKLDQYHIPTLVAGVLENDEKVAKLRRYLKNVAVDNGTEGVDQNFLRESSFVVNSLPLLNLGKI